MNALCGRNSGYNITTGQGNTVMGGSAALYHATTADYSSAFGNDALQNVTTGHRNTGIGMEAGFSVTTGANNVFLGNKAGYGHVTTANDQLYIARSDASAGNAGCWIYGNNTGTCHQGDNSQHWGTMSDQRLKKDIVDNNVGLSVINNVKVRNFKYKQYTDGSPVSTDDTVDISDFPQADNVNQVLICQGHTETQLGVVAQELESVLPNSVKTNETTGVKTVESDEIFWHMLNAIKELSTKNDALEARIQTLEG